MILTLKADATKPQIDSVLKKIKELGFYAAHDARQGDDDHRRDR